MTTGTATRLAGPPAAEAVIATASAQAAGLPTPPHLVIVRVGDDPASVSYVRGKAKKAGEAGLRSTVHALPEATPQADLLALVATLNADPDVHGILVQLPLPAHIAEEPVLEAIDPDKDVDGLHPVNVGRLWSGRPALAPCTPAGIMAMLAHYGVAVAGRRVVIVGRSRLVGRPLAGLMLAADATVTVAHSRTRDLAAITRSADILVAAVGRAHLITPDMVAPGAVVIDVGINRVVGEDGKSHLTGDVHPHVAAVASALTPVPGGVGPMTVAQLMANTVQAAERQRSGALGELLR
ncbi:methylenetetrahydrofolate dehydrogenase (NADP+)/methenyltetrahydrofolate cyclohydrolase [Deinococcus metalli]|uniref:Bifunctional protein FolD n=1 Tax=Deinococcus metalli TaxID=1141878 RepID=A0A7W8NP46_9DEIO|nr:bifunctional methylenetetrahydrofolate dehydrogenase/methenyltetrahydrofolate cyclohydrolase FolD [Deinococcus metalli]MBB5375365.1 methylenetetrahydrofolate dehydrogenase (NADP+)/methenyltetrahydrofolate cyclohydrolase [Deinococcus metalli]GHF29851.1 bifunctional protein FolD [Deinococcus metalli]